MLNVVKPRVLMCALALLLNAGGPPLIAADEVNGFAVGVTPATNRIAAKPLPKLGDTLLVIALADPAVAASNTKPPLRTVPSSKSRSWPTPARFFTINQVLAKRENSPSSVELASIRPTETARYDRSEQFPLTQGEEPFGLFTFRAPDGLVSLKWRKLEADIEAEAPALERCRVEPMSCTPAAARYVDIIRDAALLDFRAKVQLVNERVNEAIRYTEDSTQWHQADVWSAPLDVSHRGSFDTGMGDCEDYATAKYVALRQAGVAEADLRVLLVKDQAVHLDHAVLAVRDEGRWVILDNRWSRLAEDNDLRQFMPLFALNHDGVKLFAAPYAMRTLPPTNVPGAAGSASYLDAGLGFPNGISVGPVDALQWLM